MASEPSTGYDRESSTSRDYASTRTLYIIQLLAIAVHGGTGMMATTCIYQNQGLNMISNTMLAKSGLSGVGLGGGHLKMYSTH